MVSVANYPFRHAKSEISYHLTKSESQADTTVGVLQGFDIGLFANPARLMQWLTQLVGRPLPCSLDSAITHKASSMIY